MVKCSQCGRGTPAIERYLDGAAERFIHYCSACGRAFVTDTFGAVLGGLEELNPVCYAQLKERGRLQPERRYRWRR